MTSTAGQWSNLFHNLPARTPASQLYTEESISNEELTADQLIDKAQTNASLLAEIIAASTDVILNLHDFENSEIIQTLHRECQGISDYLFERIWHDSGNDDSHYYAYKSSSRHETQQKTPEEEAQIAAFIACNEQIQASFRGYDELRDFLQAKQMQADENARAHVSTLDNDLDSDYDHDSDDDNYDTAPGTSTSHGQLLTDHDDDDTLSRNHQHQHHLRKSKQPLVWKLDPREDFKANKMKMKKKMDQDERERLDRERMQERKEALHIPNEVAIPPEVLVVDHPVQPAEERELEELEFRRMKEEEINKALAPEAGAEVARLNPVAQVEEEEEDEEDAGALSDDSWEEIPGPSVVGLSVEDSGSSSSSSFLITSDTSPSRTPN
ncbi:hypothetical protein BGZ74_006120 [Mortierella antarctica]|nr:hypothetical protein BGZ74_006120 [Mortierella antarctica]